MHIGTWTDAAAIATFVTVVGGGTYAVVKWLRQALRNEINEETAPKFDALADEVKLAKGAIEALGRDVRTHMTSEDENRDRTVDAIEALGARLSREIGQMQWRRGDPPDVADER